MDRPRAIRLRETTLLSLLLVASSVHSTDTSHVGDLSDLLDGDRKIAIQSWLVAGPFASADLSDPLPTGPKRTGYDTDFLAFIGGEATARPRPGTVVPNPDGDDLVFEQQTWAGSFIDLTKPFGKLTNVCAYIYAEVESDRDTSAYLHVGSDDAAKMWVGGVQVVEHPLDGGAEPSEHVVRVSFRRGRTPILAKVDQAGGRWGAYVKVASDSVPEAEEKLFLPALDPSLQRELTEWLAANGKDPVEYVVDLFDKRDVVILWEYQGIKHNQLLVQSLIGPLYEAGVRTLATEYLRRDDQPRIDSLLTAPEWDEGVARDLHSRVYIWMGYRESIDVYRSAWAVNGSLPEGAPPFRILGLSGTWDWAGLAEMKAGGRWAKLRLLPSLLLGNFFDRDWVPPIVETVEPPGEKVLVHCSQRHAFTRYKQPIAVDGKFVRFMDGRYDDVFGYRLHLELGTRLAMVYLHAPWPGKEGWSDGVVYPADGIIDTLMLGRAGGPHPVGFDVAGSPFGRLVTSGSYYRYGYEPFYLKDFCDGWIYTKPFSEYEGVTSIEGWVNEGNLDQARAGMPKLDMSTWSVAEFKKGFAEQAGEVPRRIRHLR